MIHQPELFATTSSPGPQGTLRALLVAVRSYPNIPEDWGTTLAGCHNDLVAMRQSLLDRGFAAANVRLLLDPVDGCDCPVCAGLLPQREGLPTRQGILDAVHELTDACATEDVAVIYYSGHGSEMLGRHLQAGQRIQTLVPHDSGRGRAQNRDINDGEIRGWLRALHAKTPYVTLIFDCCHSGGLSETRGDASDTTLGNRRIKADERLEDSAYLPEVLEGLRQSSTASQSTGLRAPSLTRGHGWREVEESTHSAVVLSACAAHELSSETVSDGRKHGLFTLRLCQALDQDRNRELTWADIFPQIVAKVSGENLSQHPRRQGNAPLFAPGPIDPDDVDPPDVVELHKLAVVIGLDYDTSEVASEDRPQKGFTPLRTPVQDARQVAHVLEKIQGYEIVGLNSRNPGPLLNAKANRRRIHKLIQRLIAARARTRRDCAVLIYFAGHGVTRTLEDGSQAGYLIPWDAETDDPSTWLSMKDLRDQLVDGIRDAERLAGIGLDKPLERLTSRHLLLVLDCCFGGALSFDFFRGGEKPERPIYYSEYRRYVEGRAWQLLTSASYNQEAMDRNPRDPDQSYSPFAQALIEGLSSAAADQLLGGRLDQIITASELHQFIDNRLKQQGVDIQTPGLIALRPVEGQYIFHVPGAAPSPLPDPPLHPSHNPWPGPPAYDAPDLFFGRQQATLDLLDRFLERGNTAIALCGPSGSGKTSLVQAGLFPILDDPVVGRQRLRSWLQRGGSHHLLVTDEDLAGLRQWIQQEGLPLDDSATALAHAVRRSAQDAKWLLDHEEEEAPEGKDGGGEAQVHMQVLGIPSFSSDGGQSTQPSWWKRLGLRTLLNAPDELASRLRRWAVEGGLVDFLNQPDASLHRLVGRWNIITSRAEADTSSNATPLLWLDGLETLPEVPPEGDPAPVILAAVRCVPSDDRDWMQQVSQQPAKIDVEPSWREPEETSLEPHTPPTTDGWTIYHLPKPTRDELLDIVQGPAAARVLFLEPAQLADRLVDSVLPMTTPLPVLSSMLAGMVERAWRRRRDTNRELTLGDLETPDAAQWLCLRAETTYSELLQQDPSLEASLKSFSQRFLSFDGPLAAPRPITFCELEMAHPEEARRLHEHILPAFLAQRVLVATAEHLELAHPELADRWTRLHSPKNKRQGKRTPMLALWQGAMAWRASGFDPNKLWPQEPAIPHLVHSTALNHLERAFVLCSEMERRAISVAALAGQAKVHLSRNGSLSAMLAAEAVSMALENRDSARHLNSEIPRKVVRGTLEIVQRQAEQVLHDVLGTTPFSIPLQLPKSAKGTLVGLDFDGDTHVWIRLEEPENQARVYAWHLDDLASGYEERKSSDGPEPGQGAVQPRRVLLGLVVEFPMVPEGPSPGPKAQTGHDHSVRFFPAHRASVPPKLLPFAQPPLALHGHSESPTFLAFSPDLRWLASGADSADGIAEIRLWPIKHRRHIPAHPQAFEDTSLEQLLRIPDFASWSPSTVEPNGTSWTLQATSHDGQRLLLQGIEGANETSGQNPVTTTYCLDLEAETFLHSKESAFRHRLPRPPRSFRDLPLRQETRQIRQVLSSPDGHWLAVLSTANEAWLWSLDTFGLSWKSDNVTCIAFNPTSTEHFLVTGSEAGRVSHLDRDMRSRLLSNDDLGRISSLAFHPDGQQLAIGALDGTVYLTGLTASQAATTEWPQEPLTLSSERDRGYAVRSLAFDAQGERLAVERRAIYAPHSRRVDVYQLHLETLICLARGHAGGDLRDEDMPSQAWHLSQSAEHRHLAKLAKEEETNRREIQRYLAALGLS